MKHLSDNGLVEAVRKSNQEAFEILYYRYYDSIYRFLYSRTYSADDTDDLTVTTSTTKYVYDIRMKDSSGENIVLLSGELKVLQPITRSTSI